MATAEAIAVIQATLAPAFLMTGGGIFLNFTQARLFRVNDHLRKLALEGRAEQGALVTLALRRGRVLRNSIVFGVTGLGLVALTMLTLLMDVLIPWSFPAIGVVIPFGAGVASLTTGLFLGAYDTFLSFRVIDLEFRR